MTTTRKSCPRCGEDLSDGLGTYCWTCHSYVEDPEPTTTAPAAPEPSEKQIQAGISRFLQEVGLSVYDLSQPRNTMQTPGLPDLYVVGCGRCLWAECKKPGGRQSEAQEAFQADVEANGGEYVVWMSAEDAREWYEGVREA